MKRHMRHVGGGLLALFNGDEHIRDIGVTPGWNFKDRDEVIARFNDLEAANQRVRELELDNDIRETVERERLAALTAAEAVADRLRPDAERWQFIVDRYQGAAFVEGNKNWELRFSWEFHVPDNRGYGAVNEAIDAARNELTASLGGSGEG